MLNRNEKMAKLEMAGLDTSKYFTLLVEKDIPAGSKINVSVEKAKRPTNMDEFAQALKAELDQRTEDEVAKRIIDDGFVRNSKLHRRFVAARYFRMLESPEGYHGYLNTYYSYMYQFEMMFEEVRVLSKLERKDKETFNERRQFFTFEIVNRALEDYVKAVKKHVNELKVKRCKGRPYVSIAGFGDVFVDEVDKKIINPIEATAELCKRNYTYKGLYDSLMTFKKAMIKLPYDTKKSKTWVSAFQCEGAFYTLKNLIMFHEVDLYYDGRFYDKYNAMEILNNLAGRYDGYQMNALLKETIKMNDFNFWDSVEAHK